MTKKIKTEVVKLIIQIAALKQMVHLVFQLKSKFWNI